jgi:hypothetical protein
MTIRLHVRLLPLGMGVFGKPGPDKLSSISNNQIWPLGLTGLNRKFLWFPKTGFVLNEESVICREIEIDSEGTPELHEFLKDFFDQIHDNVVAKMETWPNEAHFNAEHYFHPQDATIELGSRGQNQKLVKVFGFLERKDDSQAIYFSKVEKLENCDTKKTLVKVIELNAQNDKYSWFIINQITPKDRNFTLGLFLTMRFDLGASHLSHLYLHLPVNHEEMRRYLNKVGL